MIIITISSTAAAAATTRPLKRPAVFYQAVLLRVACVAYVASWSSCVLTVCTGVTQTPAAVT